MTNTVDDYVLSGATLRGTGFGGYGYGFGPSNQGNFLGDGSAIKEAVRGNRDIDLLEAVNRNSTDQFLNQKITDGDAAVTSAVNMGNRFLSEQIRERQITEGFASMERQLFAFQSDNQRDIANLNAKVTECCCKLEAGQAAIQAKLDAQALQNAQTENLNLRIQLSQGQAQGN